MKYVLQHAQLFYEWDFLFPLQKIFKKVFKKDMRKTISQKFYRKKMFGHDVGLDVYQCLMEHFEF